MHVTLEHFWDRRKKISQLHCFMCYMSLHRWSLLVIAFMSTYILPIMTRWQLFLLLTSLFILTSYKVLVWSVVKLPLKNKKKSNNPRLKYNNFIFIWYKAMSTNGRGAWTWNCDPGFWFVVVKEIRYPRLNNAFHAMESVQFKQVFRFCPVAISSLLFCHHCWGCRNVAVV